MYKTVEYPDVITGEGYEHFIDEDGDKYWYYDGDYHRIDGPSEIERDEVSGGRDEYWSIRGKWHREDGPAIIEYDKDGNVIDEEWYLQDRELSKENFTSVSMINKMKAWSLFTPTELVRMRLDKQE